MAEDDYMFCVNTLNDIRKLPNELKARNRVQRIVLFFHFTMLRAKFIPEYSEENNEEGGEGSSTTATTQQNNNNNKNKEQPAVKVGWNSSADVFHFKYSHPSLPSSTVHMKIIPMEHLLLVHSTCSSPLPSPSPSPSPLLSLEVNMNEYISEYMTENEGEYKWKALQAKFKTAIVYPLLPSLQPPSPSPPSSRSFGSGGDPLRISEPKQTFFSPFAPPSISPYNVGHSDVFPDFSGGIGGIGSGGGMEVGPNHEMFRNYPAPPNNAPPLYYGNDDEDDVNFHFNPRPSPFSPNPSIPQGPGVPQGPSPRFDPVGPLPSQNDKKNNKKDKRSPFGPDPDHLPMPGANKDWYI